MKSDDPSTHVGVYKRYEDVPGHYRLDQYARQYDGRDVWAEFIAADDRSAWLRTTNTVAIERVEREWKAHCEQAGVHHALATPEVVNDWAASSLASRSVTTTQHPYWSYIEGFYSWLQSRTDYPHVYHPVRMAAIAYPEAREVWDYRMSHRARHKTGGEQP